MRFGRQLLLSALICAPLSRSAMFAEDLPAHGLWVWKTPSVLQPPHGAEKLRDFCRSAGITEVYVSVPASGGPSIESQLIPLITLLHQSAIRVEALLSSTNADEPGAPRDKLIGQVRQIVQFNGDHAGTRFDGIHLDIEPQQRPENKGPGNLTFLPGLVDTYRAVRTEAATANLHVNADIQTKLLKASLAERKLLLSSLPRLTLMLYEVSSPGDGESSDQKAAKLRARSQKLFNDAYNGLGDSDLARLAIGLRDSDYGELLPRMLTMVNEANRDNPHYCGWAWHSYNASPAASSALKTKLQ